MSERSNWVRRLAWLGRAVVVLMVLGATIYLVGGWLRADADQGQRTQLDIRDGWIFLRPTWLYAVALLAILFAALAAVGYVLAKRHTETAFWREQIRSQADALQQELEILQKAPPQCLSEAQVDAIAEAVKKQLKTAKEAAVPDEASRRSSLTRLVEAWSGASIRAAFSNLHAAEVAIVRLLSEEQIEAQIPEALARLEALPKSDQRRQEAEVQLREGKPGPKRRAAFATAVRLGHEIKDDRHAHVRSFRNIIYAATLGLTGVVVALCIIGASFPDAIPLCFAPDAASTTTTTTTTTTTPPAETAIASRLSRAPTAQPQQTTTTTIPQQTTTTVPEANTVCPSEEQPPTPNPSTRRLPAPGDVALVALFGLLGGALSGTLAIRKLQGSSTPYSVSTALSLLKLPSGALTAIVGILLVRGEFIPGLSQLDNQPQILAYAFIFGIAQLAVTRYVDDRGQEVMRRVPSKAAPEREKEAADGERAPPEAAVAAAAKRKRRPRLSRR
jgi:hypothetical protein